MNFYAQKTGGPQFLRRPLVILPLSVAEGNKNTLRKFTAQGIFTFILITFLYNLKIIYHVNRKTCYAS